MIGIAKKKNFDQDKMAIAVRGHRGQIRKLDDLSRKAALIRELKLVSSSYGARVEIDKTVMAECIALVIKKFGFIGIQEIREAYRQWAAKEFTVEGSAMYGGVFNADQLGKVITGYLEHRKKLLAAYLGAIHQAAEDAHKEKRHKNLKENFIPTFIQSVQKFREDGCVMSQVPIWWWFTYKREWIVVDDETKEELLAEARELSKSAKLSLESQRSEAKLIGEVFKMPSDSSITKDIAKKLTLFQFLVMDDSWEEKALFDHQNEKY